MMSIGESAMSWGESATSFINNAKEDNWVNFNGLYPLLSNTVLSGLDYQAFLYLLIFQPLICINIKPRLRNRTLLQFTTTSNTALT